MNQQVLANPSTFKWEGKWERFGNGACFWLVYLRQKANLILFQNRWHQTHTLTINEMPAHSTPQYAFPIQEPGYTSDYSSDGCSLIIP